MPGKKIASRQSMNFPDKRSWSRPNCVIMAFAEFLGYEQCFFEGFQL
jgi:hypothetical protein